MSSEKLLVLIFATSFAERVIFVSLHVIVFITSLFGDSIILIGTIKYKAIKQHRVIVAVIQHLAALDILASVLYVLPKTATLITDRWDLGPFLCTAYSFFWDFYLTSTSLSALALLIFKLMIVKYPLRTVSWSSMKGHRICAALYFFSIILNSPTVISVIFFAVDDKVYFSQVMYACARVYGQKVFEILGCIMIGLSVMNFIFPIPTIAASVALLLIAKKSASRIGRSLKWDGVITIVVTVLVYAFSNWPYAIERIQIYLRNSPLLNNIHLLRFTVHLLTLNIMSNFFIYCLTIRSFREFLRLKISEILSRSVHPVRRPALTSQMQIIELQQRNVDEAED